MNSPATSSFTGAQGIDVVNLMQPHISMNPASHGSVVSSVQITVHPTGSEDTQTTAQALAQQGNLARADHEIYCNQLLTKKRGLPLWVPGPGRRLPIEYRRLGISIGDVGIITSTGEFDFLFNIFQPADNSINRGGVPEGFVPLSFDGLADEILENNVYGPGSYLASSSVRKANDDWLTKILSYFFGHRFESTEQEAAILIMPDGSTSQDLRNTWGIRETISRKAQGWYTYARQTRGRADANNGHIRVVVGVDKVSSWGMATSASNTGQTASFVFKRDWSHFYRWDCIGGNGRAGPNQSEVADLINANASPQNQCVFLRTINFTLSGEMWNNLPSVVVEQVHQGSGHFADPERPNNQGESKGQSSSDMGTSSSHQSGSIPESHCTQSVQFGPVELEAASHPSTALHNYLHEKFPDAHMVITEDEDWISVLKDDDMVFPETADLCARILEAHEVQNDGGIVQILRRDGPRPQASSSTAVQEGSANAAPSSVRKVINTQPPIDDVHVRAWSTELRKSATKLGKRFAASP